jgi:hypothetical protein
MSIWRYFVSISSALVEISIGLSLLFSILLSLVVPSISLLHITILFAVGPWGSNRFHGIWLWNFFCAIMSPILFYNIDSVSYNYVFEAFGQRDYTVILFWFVFGFAPFLSYASLWNPQWSFQMHSCNFPEMYCRLFFIFYFIAFYFPDVTHKLEA